MNGPGPRAKRNPLVTLGLATAKPLPTDDVAIAEGYQRIRSAGQKQTAGILQLDVGTHQLGRRQIEIDIDDDRIHGLAAKDGLAQLGQSLDDGALALVG